MVKLEDLNIGGLKIYQDTDGFRFGTDSVLLAWFACLKKTKSVCDLCSGCGIVGVLVSAFSRADRIRCVEIDPAQAELARRTVEYNGLGGRLSVACADVKNVRQNFEYGSFDLVTANPPYQKLGVGKPAASAESARSETLCSVDDITAAAKHLLKTGGRLCLVHRADRVADVLCSMRNAGTEPKRLMFVQAKPGREPYILLCEGIKGARPGMRVDSPFLIMNERGEYTDSFKAAFGGRLSGL